ncbi:flocculation protein FLO11-like [Anabas testudineus]|uniref:flocculation protein FLO11-like n=1 Tax=Anabas testudineus TaxID=64144 RepID=UPI000E45FD1F|nr:flocculation protein FLO11-like [Anabas testudineus]
MELPLGGPALRHYTQSRPRPHRQKLNYRPSRPQETIIESENEVLELMGRVDEGVEEFFTKRVLPSDTLKRQDDESITVHEVAPASSVPCPPPTKTLRRKLGDFFTLKKKRGLKSEASHEGRPKKTSIADLIRPLREVARAEKEKDKDRVKEHDKENEKEKVKEQPSGVSEESAVQETPVPSALPLRGEAVPPRRALREGKSQSLILLSGSAAAGTTNARNNSKKQFEGQHSFEQKLHLMLQRIGVSKPQPGETQNQEGEMKKAESEGTIIDSKPEPPPTFSKPRTMSASADTRHQIRPSVSAHESAGKPALLPKPVLKPGPPPTTSGRNTPENELTQIQEAETHTPTKPSPTAVPSPPPPATTAPTVSNSIPDSASFCPSSTVTASDTEICTDSVDPAAAATTPTNATELDSKTSVLEATTTELPISTFPTTTTSSTTPPEPPATASVTSTSSESINPSLPVTSSSATISTPSITTLETASAPGDESSVTASTNMSTELTLPEPNVILSVDAGPADGGDAATSVIATSSSPSTTISSMPISGLSTTTDSVTEASDGLRISTSAVTPDSSVPKTASPSDTALPDTTMTTSSTLPSTTTMSSVSQSATLIPADVSAPSTSSSETTPTDTTPTISRSTRTDNTYTTSSATTAAISSPLATDSDPPHINNVSTTIAIPTISSLPDNSTAASQHLTSPVPSSDNTVQDNELQTSPGGRSSVEPAEKATADKVEIVQTEMGENKDDGGKKSKDDNEKPTEVNSKETRKEAQEESVKTEEDTTTAPPSGIESVRCSDEEAIESLKQQQDKSVSEK